jgi:hypothetical protein
VATFLRSGGLLAAAMPMCTLLCGCSVWSPEIRADVADYSDVIEQSTDEFLLRNILEARDNAPVHFVELPKINGALQAQAGLSTAFPYYARSVAGGNGIINATVTPNITVQSSPSFEVDSLASKEFSTGVSSQIDPSSLKYWYDRGLDRRLLLLLFFSAAKISESCPAAVQCHRGVVTVRNDPRKAVDVMDWSAGAGPVAIAHETQFGLYLQIVNAINGKFIVHDYSEKTELAEAVALEPKDIAAFDPKNYTLELVKSGKKGSYNIYTAAVAHKVELCIRWSETSTTPVGRPFVPHKSADACSQTEVILRPDRTPPPRPEVPEVFVSDDSLPDSCRGAASSGATNPVSQYCGIVEDLVTALREGHPRKGVDLTLSLTPRSAAGLVRFIGDLLYYQDHAKADCWHNVPVTLSYVGHCNAPEDLQKEGGWIFRLNGKNGPPRFSLEYRGHSYTIAQDDRRDHSLEVLAIVNQVINLNKSAPSLATTPTVRVIP